MLRVRAGSAAARRATRIAAVLAVALVLGACTDEAGDGGTPGPSPSGSAPTAAAVDTGRRVMVVIGPATRVAPGEAAALASAAAAIDVSNLTDVSEVRVLKAQTVAFAADLVDLAVIDGYDLVCVVGTGTADILAAAAATHRATRFCGTDAGTPSLANAAVVGLDVLSLTQVAAAAASSSPSPVGLVVGSTVSPLGPVEAAFRDAVGPGPVVEPTPEPTPTPTPAPTPEPDPDATAVPTPAATPTESADDADLAAASHGGGLVAAALPTQLAAAIDDGRVLAVASDGVSIAPSVVDLLRPAAPSTAVLLAPGASEAGRVLADGGASLVVVAAWATDSEGQLPGQILMAIRIDWAAQLRGAVEDGLATDVTGVRLLGAGDGVFTLVEGGATGSTAAVRLAQDRISDAAPA